MASIKKIFFGLISVFLAAPSFIALQVFADIGVKTDPKLHFMEPSFFLWLTLSSLGIAFAIIGLIKKNQKKFLSVIGLIANLLILLLPLAIYLLLFAHEVSESGWDKFIP